MIRSITTLALLQSVLLCSAQPLQLDLVPFSTGHNSPVDIQNAGDSRLFIVEQPGRIEIVDDQGNTNAQPFLDIQNKVNNQGGEQGLLGLAFHPNYLSNGYFYVNYTNAGDSTVIARYSVSGNPDIADPNSEFVIMTFNQPFTNHNAGQLVFGPDGYLYIGTGDGGSAGDPGDRAQDSLNILGKMHRIDVDAGSPYGIPPTNPFVGNPAAMDEIWAVGLRNPWRYSFDPVSGDLWIADVGQNQWEEINVQDGMSSGGENYGWRCYEGNHNYNTSNCSTDTTLFTFPVHEYPHSGSVFSCSVTGGHVYRGSDPDMYGRYFYADVCSGEIHTLEETSPGVYTDELVYTDASEAFVTFGTDINGEQYVSGLNSGIIYHINVAVGISEARENPIAIYPNPASNKVTIDRKDETPVSSVKIISLSGQIVRSIKGNGSRLIDIDLSGLEGGVYFVVVNFENGHIRHKKLLVH